MSAVPQVASPRAFLPTLREVERQLPIPLPRKVRVLRELEFDLEELHARFLARGLSPDEARQKALEVLVPGPDSLDALRQVHMPWYRRATRHVADDRLRRIERWALAGSALAVLVAETVFLLQMNLLTAPSPFLWPVLALGALLFAFVASEAFRLWIKGEHRDSPSGLTGILMLSGFTFFTGLAGAMADFFRLADRLEGGPDMATALVGQWLVRDAALLSVAILIALAGGLAWFLLIQWLAAVSGAHREILGLARFAAPTTRR